MFTCIIDVFQDNIGWGAGIAIFCQSVEVLLCLLNDILISKKYSIGH